MGVDALHVALLSARTVLETDVKPVELQTLIRVVVAVSGVGKSRSLLRVTNIAEMLHGIALRADIEDKESTWCKHIVHLGQRQAHIRQRQ